MLDLSFVQIYFQMEIGKIKHFYKGNTALSRLDVISWLVIEIKQCIDFPFVYLWKLYEHDNSTY